MAPPLEDTSRSNSLSSLNPVSTELGESHVLPCRECDADPKPYLEEMPMKVAVTPTPQIVSLRPWARKVIRVEAWIALGGPE